VTRHRLFLSPTAFSPRLVIRGLVITNASCGRIATLEKIAKHQKLDLHMTREATAPATPVMDQRIQI